MRMYCVLDKSLVEVRAELQTSVRLCASKKAIIKPLHLKLRVDDLETVRRDHVRVVLAKMAPKMPKANLIISTEAGSRTQGYRLWQPSSRGRHSF